MTVVIAFVAMYVGMAIGYLIAHILMGTDE